MRNWIKSLWNDQSGQDFIEYTLLAASIVIIIAGILPFNITPAVTTVFTTITSALAVS